MAFTLTDVQSEIVDIIGDISGITAWQNRLPVGFENTSKTATVILETDTAHLTGATRAVFCKVRIYGGSGKLADLKSAVESIYGALAMKTTETIAITGGFVGQQLPPEPITGWVTYNLRFQIRTKE